MPLGFGSLAIFHQNSDFSNQATTKQTCIRSKMVTPWFAMALLILHTLAKGRPAQNTAKSRLFLLTVVKANQSSLAAHMSFYPELYIHLGIELGWASEICSDSEEAYLDKACVSSSFVTSEETFLCLAIMFTRRLTNSPAVLGTARKCLDHLFDTER
jgi:hypothetical protein